MALLSTDSIYEFKNYKEYLEHWISLQVNKGRGEKSRIAEHLRCQLAYISQVLGGLAQLSLEQADSLNSYLGHSDSEAEFFNLLVQHQRAGSEGLRSRIQAQVKRALERRLILQNRLEYEKKLSREDQMTYYSSWHYSAVHIALAIPNLRNRAALQKAFSLSPTSVAKVLDFLTITGLASENKNKYSIGETRIHLENDSPMIGKHHTNWRMQAIQLLDEDSIQDLHYSSVITLAEKDVLVVREILIRAIQNIRETIRPSADETLYCYSMDLFNLLKDRR